MFKVLDIEHNEFRTTLDWSTREDLESIFRTAGREGQLRCPHCREHVIFRYSDIYLPHFAHKALGDCPYSSESIMMLQARAALYFCLKTQFGTAVQVEHVLSVEGVPRPVDCWVPHEKSPLAYWLLEKGMRGETRLAALQKGIVSMGAVVQFVFLAQMLRELPEEKGVYRLTPTEEYLMQRSKYDNIYSDYKYGAGSLHYLAAEGQQAQMTTLRSLTFERCGRHFSTPCRLQTELSKIKIAADCGEFVHPGEDTFLTEYEREAAERERQRQARRLKLARVSSTWVRPAVAQVHTLREPQQAAPATQAPAFYPAERAGPCERCGTVTTDWVVFDGKTGKCKCNNCFQKKGTSHG